MTTWSSRADITPGTISAIQACLTVRLVMTARASLMPCRPEDPVDAVMADNVGQFSFLPVENEGRICGLYRAEQWFGREELPSRPIDQDFEPLTEDNLVGSDASILKFLATAVEHPTRLVVSDTEVVGLVCLSDVQKHTGSGRVVQRADRPRDGNGQAHRRDLAGRPRRLARSPEPRATRQARGLPPAPRHALKSVRCAGSAIPRVLREASNSHRPTDTFLRRLKFRRARGFRQMPALIDAVLSARNDPPSKPGRQVA